MKKRSGLFFIFLFLLCTRSNLVHAETDYRCLKLCLAEGKIYYKCSFECSYGDLQEKEKKEEDLLIKTPRLWEDSDVVEYRSTVKKNVQKDYMCLKSCLQDGLQHGLCLRRCEKREESLEK